MSDQDHAVPARRQVRGRAGGRLRSLLLTVEHGVASPVVAGGTAGPELYSLQLPHGRPPRAVTAPAKGASAQTGARARRRETVAAGTTATQFAERDRRALKAACPPFLLPHPFPSRH